MPPTAETDPSARIGLGIAGTTLAVGAVLVSPASALAHENGADIEKAALAAWNNAPTRDINSFSGPASVATGQVVEAPAMASTSFKNDYLVPGPDGLVSASASSADAPDPALEQLCVEAGLARPKILDAKVGNPGDKKKQIFFFKAQYRPMPEVCRGLYKLIPENKFYMENPQNNEQQIKIRPYRKLGNVDDDGGIAQSYYSRYPFQVPFKKRYRCTPGKGVTDAFTGLRNTVIYIPDGSSSGSKEYEKRMRIPGGTPDSHTGRVGGRC